jgi:hypothetical protein
MDWEIILEPAEVLKCKDFADKSAKTQRPHRSGGSQIRDLSMISTDTFRGKLGEVVCNRFFEQNPLNITYIILDFDIYPRGKWDEADFLIKNKKFSIKSVKHFSSWLLVESKDIARGDVYDYFILIQIRKSMDGGVIAGYARQEEIVNGDRYTLNLRRGDFIPGTNTPLDADNQARHKNYLHNSEADWTLLAKELNQQSKV